MRTMSTFRGVRFFGEDTPPVDPRDLPPPEECRSLLAESRGVHYSRNLPECETCPDRAACNTHVRRYDTFLHPECNAELRFHRPRWHHPDPNRPTDRVLTLLRAADQPVTADEIAAHLACTKKEAWEIANRLCRQGRAKRIAASTYTIQEEV
jgi:hypothetical protein